MLTNATLSFVFLAFLSAVVRGEDSGIPPYKLFPPFIPATRSWSGDNRSYNVVDDVEDNPCTNYKCGDYSLAAGLGGSNATFNWTTIFEDRSNSPIQSIRAGVSCAFNPDRDFFDGDDDSSRHNNINNMTWTTNEGTQFYPLANPINFTNRFYQLRGSKKDYYEDAGITIPKNIHIRVYAIDDDLEFKYRSNPCNLVTPVYDKMYASLEMWIPNWILESTTILGPHYDYSLGIEIGGTVNSGGSGGNDETTIDSSENNKTSADRDGGDPNLLLTKGPPSRLTIVNKGIGTQKTLVINTTTTSDDPKLDSHTELKFIDESLNGEVRIKTDHNVSGTIQIDGNNVRAAIV